VIFRYLVRFIPSILLPSLPFPLLRAISTDFTLFSYMNTKYIIFILIQIWVCFKITLGQVNGGVVDEIKLAKFIVGGFFWLLWGLELGPPFC
jgi:hypothetical protein